MTDKLNLIDRWKFPWPIMDVLIGGMSSIDLPEMLVTSWDEATDFLISYGYNPDDLGDARRMHQVIVEALAFIEKHLLTPHEWERGVKPPDELLYCDDVRHLLLLASGKDPRQRLARAWACAILRVMHTIAHIEGVNRYASIDTAREQIMTKFQKYIFRDENMDLWFGTPSEKVRLEKVEWKIRKSRNSIILKLLHKRDNVAETIYDYLGMRIVTSKLSDAMVVVKYLREFNMVAFPNCYPSRARNNLIDIPRFKTQIEALRDMLSAGSLSPDEFEEMVARLTSPKNISMHINPHSSHDYRAIQMTCRQMIKVQNPQLTWLDRLEREIDLKQLPEGSQNVLIDLRELVGKWHAVKENREIRAFFPFELQILDSDAYAKAVAGEANHSRYKRSQVRAARKRILNRVLELSR